jgi:hypothetical protein
MGFRYRSSIRLAKGLRINLSKSGASLSVGRPGATVNFSKRGTRATVGLPGTGISYSETKPWGHQADRPAGSSAPARRGFSLAWLALIGVAIGIVAALIW